MINKLNKKKVVAAMSGGVDSAAAAFLLQKQGYEVLGLFMRLGINHEESELAAREICRKLKIKYYPVNLAGKFKKEIIDYFTAGYKQGLTPNPCVQCNKLIKFKELLRITDELGADYLATGHYIRKIPNSKFQIPNKSQTPNSKLQPPNYYELPVFHQIKLYRGIDRGKDQSYFLYNLTQEQLRRIIFPLGDYTKEEVKRIADKAGLPYLTKESQDICFLQGDHNDFLRAKLKLKPGLIKTLDGKLVGEHQGLPLYTIGQRKGVEIGGIGPFYVAKTDYKTNTLYVVSDKDDSVLCQDEFGVKEVNWISGVEPSLPFKCETVIRYRHKPVKCSIAAKNGHEYAVKLKEPQRAVTPGQSAVFYGIRRAATKGAHANMSNERELLGGGVII